ncbi:MAG: glycosyltransferase family 9 protein [Alphaproteobacteria bacterium]
MVTRSFPILFITSTRIGDAVLSSGLIRRLADELPDARFTIVAGPLAAPLFENTPNLDALIVTEKRPLGMHWYRLWRQVRQTSWGLVVDLRGSIISNILRRKKRAVHRRNAHDVHKVLEAAHLLGLDDNPPAPFLYVDDARRRRAQDITAGDGPILALGPASNWVGKVWPIERFAQTAIRLLGEDGPLAGGRLMILGGPDDVRTVEELKRSLTKGRVIDLTGQVDLLTAYACLSHARLYIGNDSGLMHLAAAAGTPTLALFGPSDERLYGPWGAHVRALRGPRSFEQFKQIDPELSQSIRHMSDLPVDSVVEAARVLLQESDHG